MFLLFKYLKEIKELYTGEGESLSQHFVFSVKYRSKKLFKVDLLTNACRYSTNEAEAG